MSPRDGGSTESLVAASNSLGETIDWSWIDNLNPEGGKYYVQLSFDQDYRIKVKLKSNPN